MAARSDDMVTTLPDGRPLIDNTGRPIKRKRPQSCDACRTRKTRCIVPVGEGLEASGDVRCLSCRSAAIECSWTYVPKRPGPQTHLSGNGAKKKSTDKIPRDASREATNGAGPSSAAAGPPGPPMMPALPPPPVPPHIAHPAHRSPHSHQLPSPRTSGFLEAAQMSAHFDNPPPNPFQPSQYGLKHESHPHHDHHPSFPPMMPPPLTGASPSSSSPSSRAGRPPPPMEPRSTMGWTSSPGVTFELPQGPSPSAHRFASNHHSPLDSTTRSGDGYSPSFPGFPPPFGSNSGHKRLSSSQPGSHTMSLGPSPPSSTSRPKARHLGKVFAAPIDRPRSLDDVAPRATFLSIISLYFHHLYPLMPIVHQPSFSHDLITRRDERDVDFLSFVLSLTAYTLIQCPRSVIPAPWPFYRKLHQICHLTSRRMQLDRHATADPPTLTQCATLYTSHIYVGSTGRTFAANAIHGELVRTAFSVNLHDETRPLPTATGVPAGGRAPGAPEMTEIERQLRRRMYWLIYGSDKTISILSDEPISLRDADTTGVEVPVAVDDDCLYPHKVGEQPAERGPSILCGFVAVTKLHQVMSKLMENFRSDRKFPPANAEATRRKLQMARDILREIQVIVAGMPEPLQNPSFEHTEPPPRPPGGLPDLSMPKAGPSSSLSSSRPQPPQLPSYGIAGVNSLLPFTPWPTGTFDENGLPIPSADGASQASSSAAASPTAPWASMSTANMYSTNGWGGGPGGSSSAAAGPSFSGSGTGGGSPPPGSPPFPPMAQLTAAREQVVAFRPSPPLADPARAPVTILSGFAICRANILVTEAMLRFVLVDYQELLRGYLSQQRIAEGEVNQPGADDEDNNDEIEEAARTFAIASLPFESLEANGQSLVLKLVFVVSSLLNRTSHSSRAFGYMSDFLQTLSKLSERRTQGDDEAGSDDEKEA